MPEQVGVFWVTQLGSLTLTVLGLVMLYTWGKGRGHAYALRVLTMLKATAGDDVSSKELREFARRSDHATWEFERQTKYGLWTCYAVAVFSAPGLAQLIGNVNVELDQDGFLQWVDIQSADGLVTVAVVAFVAARIYEWRVFAFHRRKNFAAMEGQFGFGANRPIP